MDLQIFNQVVDAPLVMQRQVPSFQAAGACGCSAGVVLCPFLGEEGKEEGHRGGLRVTGRPADLSSAPRTCQHVDFSALTQLCIVTVDNLLSQKKDTQHAQHARHTTQHTQHTTRTTTQQHAQHAQHATQHNTTHTQHTHNTQHNTHNTQHTTHITHNNTHNTHNTRNTHSNAQQRTATQQHDNTTTQQHNTTQHNATQRNATRRDATRRHRIASHRTVSCCGDVCWVFRCRPVAHHVSKIL